jgi:DNA replication protein DnaC
MDKRYTKTEECPIHGIYWECEVYEFDYGQGVNIETTLCPSCSEATADPRECYEHGQYTARKEKVTVYPDGSIGDDYSMCPKCEAAHERRWAASVEADRKARIERVGIPPRFAGKTLENYTAEGESQASTLAWAKDYLAALLKDESKGRSCLLLGDPGTGKTHLCTAIALEAARQGLEARYTTAQRMFRAIKETFNKGSDKSSTEVIREFSTVELLVIDEVGIQFGSEFESNHLFDILNERYEHLRPTLLASNLPRAEVVKYLGERVIDRFREDGGSIRMFSWKSHRGGGA